MKRVWIAAGIAFAVAVAYPGWTWLQRQDATRRMEQRAASRTRRTTPQPAAAGTAVRITQFYARSGEVTDAEQNVICYGVENAAVVRLEPPVEKLEPAFNRCFSTEPKRNTTYTLFAEGTDGSHAAASFDVRVRPAPPHIHHIDVSHSEVRRGEPVTICYGVERASRVRLEPVGMSLPPLARNCTRFYPPMTLKYTFTAYGAANQTDREDFSIKVK